MSLFVNILFYAFVLILIIGLYFFVKAFRRATAHDPNDDLYVLWNFVDSCAVTVNNACSIRDQIRTFRVRKDISKHFLTAIEEKFKFKFKELAEMDEYSPENLDTIDEIQTAELKRKLQGMRK